MIVALNMGAYITLVATLSGVRYAGFSSSVVNVFKMAYLSEYKSKKEVKIG